MTEPQSALNLIGFELESEELDDKKDDRFYSEQKKLRGFLDLLNPVSVQNSANTHFSPSDFTNRIPSNEEDDDDVFLQNESRLDSLLQKMENDVGNQQHSKQHSFS